MSTVYFSRTLTPETVVRLFYMTRVELSGRIAVKLHSGEKGNQNFLGPDFWRPMIDEIGGTVVECNTAYEGARNTTPKHLTLIREHGWRDAFPFDLMDAEGPDAVLDVPDGKVIKQNLVGKSFMNYDGMLVLSHFKGHPMGGFGGALKQLSIGCASSAGKCIIHTGGVTGDQSEIWSNCADQDVFLEAMADAAASVVRHFNGKMCFINVMKNLSVDCDCCAVAEDPCMNDVGILASDDPVALDQACVDLIYASTDPGRDHFVERIETRHGIHTVEAAEALGIGSRQYELIELL